ncbi:MAG: hypothetical protein K2N29_00295, partial [Ruminiclostridium sp.]|nr:hypothetical protein [Ruminiclostridium sp.]
MRFYLKGKARAVIGWIIKIMSHLYYSTLEQKNQDFSSDFCRPAQSEPYACTKKNKAKKAYRAVSLFYMRITRYPAKRRSP